MDSDPKHIRTISFLRVFFMLMIFVHHCDFSYGGGGCAVTAFFMISGFCMTLRYGDKVLHGNFSWWNYFKRRAIKVYPMHWIGLLLMWCLTGCYLHFGPKFIGTITLNAALLQSWIPEKTVYFSYNSPSWYLCDLLFFVAIFPYLYRWINRLSTQGKLLLLGFGVALIMVLSLFMSHDLRHAYLYINPAARVVDCLVGVYLAMAFKKIVESDSINALSKHVGYVDVGIFVLLAIVVAQSVTKIGYGTFYTTVNWITESALILLVALRGIVEKRTIGLSILQNKVIDYLGACSLSFYILHVPVMNMLNKCNTAWGVDSKSFIGGVWLYSLLFYSVELRIN